MKPYFSTLKHLITLVLVASFFSCGNNPLEIDVSKVDVKLSVKRFEQDLFQYKSGISPENVAELNSKYNVFFQDFTQSVISIGSIKHEKINQRLNDFSTDPYINEVKTDVDNIFANFSSYEADLTEAFKHYKHYFPKKNIPEVVTFISGFNYAITTDENYLGIGLDMFLGNKYEAYKQLGLPQYKSNFMGKENLVPGAMLGWVSTEFELKQKNADLLTEMIHQGKTLYLLDALMPLTDDGLKISYSDEQIKWCKNNAEPVWFYFIDNKLLYTKETKEIIKYMGEAPFIQGFPEGSPGRIGHWVGWQIVKAYMEKNPNVTVAQLMENNNAQEILNKSKYKP
ncbi:MAG: gliding motility lipoprotein GldB [Vicingaceae bacterium]